MPRFIDSRNKLILRQIAIINAPQHTIAEEGCTTGLVARRLVGVHHSTRPMALRLLKLLDGVRQTHVFLGKERLMEYEKNYEEIVRKQRDLLQKWWGTSATRKLIHIFEEIVGEPEEHETEPEFDPEMLLGGGEE